MDLTACAEDRDNTLNYQPHLESFSRVRANKIRYHPELGTCSEDRDNIFNYEPHLGSFSRVRANKIKYNPELMSIMKIGLLFSIFCLIKRAVTAKGIE